MAGHAGVPGQKNLGRDVQNRVTAPTKGRAPARAPVRKDHIMKYMIMMFVAPVARC